MTVGRQKHVRPGNMKGLLRPLKVRHLVMYNRRSACSGSESPGGFILLPQSHTLLREEVMLDDSWISAWEEPRKALIITWKRNDPAATADNMTACIKQEASQTRSYMNLAVH